jgi:hypothetical protein
MIVEYRNKLNSRPWTSRYYWRGVALCYLISLVYFIFASQYENQVYTKIVVIIRFLVVIALVSFDYAYPLNYHSSVSNENLTKSFLRQTGKPKSRHRSSYGRSMYSPEASSYKLVVSDNITKQSEIDYFQIKVMTLDRQEINKSRKSYKDFQVFEQQLQTYLKENLDQISQYSESEKSPLLLNQTFFNINQPPINHMLQWQPGLREYCL